MSKIFSPVKKSAVSLSMPTRPIQGIPEPSFASSLNWTLSIFTRFFLLAAVVYLATTGFLPLVGRDEPRYVQIGQNMLDSGDWVTPRLGGQTWFEKPVLLYWMVAASFSVFGASEWAARLGPALCGLGSAAALWWMLVGSDRKVALWSALVLLTSGGMLAFSHGATFDIVLTFCLTLALASWWKAQVDAERATRWLALFWVGVGLAFLAKGLVAFILPLGTIGLYAAFKRQRVSTGFWWGLPLALAVSALWYGPVIWTNGMAFVNEFFVQHHFQRFASDKYKHHQPFWFYGAILPLFLLPWAPWLLVALWRKRASFQPLARGIGAGWSDIELFALAWMLVPVLFFSLSGSKLPGYILPAIPGGAILIGAELSAWASNRKKRRIAVALASLVLVGSALLTSSGPAVKRAEDKSVRRLFEVAHEKGLSHLPVLSFSTTVRSAEFYAATTLKYDREGEPVCLETTDQLRNASRSGPVLVLVSDGDLDRVRSSSRGSTLHVQELARNKDTVLILVQL